MCVDTQVKLWQLINPTLPIGAFAYSQGQEYAVEVGWISDESTALQWIQSLLEQLLTRTEVPILYRCYRAATAHDWSTYLYWNQVVLAMRESAELYEEDIQLGAAMRRVFPSLGIYAVPQIKENNLSYVASFSYAVATWRIDVESAALGFLWMWCETQVAAAIKLVPLGQSAGQRILSKLRDKIAGCVSQGFSYGDDDIGMLAPGLAMGSARHEIQYSRLFRS